MRVVQTVSLTAILLISGVCTTRAGGGVTLTTVLSFGGNYTNTDAIAPTVSLVQGADNCLYGTTSSGGTNNLGAVFKITTNGVYTLLVSFDGTNGANPAGSLALGSDGNLYGTAYAGGVFGLGTVFQMTPAGVLTTLHSFNGANGANPDAGLAATTNGVLYGTTEAGGVNDLDVGGDGTVFRITTNGTFARIFSFTNQEDGGNPIAGVAVSRNGAAVFGTTQYGGVDFSGSVFKLTTNGVFTTLYSFTGGKDGSTPDAPVVLASDGNYYGTTTAGGKFDVNNGGDGTVFKITAAGVFSSLFSFDNTNGADPEAGLAQGTDGLLYGTTYAGGAPGIGTGFKITTTGTFTSLIDFEGPNGASPLAGLTLSTNGFFYGVSTQNGVDGLLQPNGTLFQLSTGGALSTLYVFGNIVPDGLTPAAGLVLGTDGYLYGTTTYGGTNHGSYGCIFRTTTNGAQTVLASFSGTNGAYPTAALMRGMDGSFYGTTTYGGTNNVSYGGNGTVFNVTTNGVLTMLASFNGTNGANPVARLVQGPDGMLYGTAETGGTNNVANGGDGTVFKITTNGVLTRLVSFNLTNGAIPVAGLTFGADGNLYGTTYAGGTNNLANGGDGTVFRVTTNGTLTRLFSFNVTNGASPAAELVTGTNGLFYGTTQTGGTNDLASGGDGTIFSITTNGVHTTLYSFANGADGGNPTSALLPDTQGNFYSEAGGGSSSGGVLFQLTPDDSLIALYSFTGGNDGGDPLGMLVEDGAFHFYGATVFGGTNSDGTLFHLYVDPFPFIVTEPAGVTNFTGAMATFTVAAVGALPLQYHWQRNGTNLADFGNVSGSATKTLTLTNLALTDAAGYSVIVTNAYGAVTSSIATLGVILPFAPAVTTGDASPVDITSATLNATVTPDGAATTVWFSYGLTTNYSSTSTTTNIGSGGDPVSVSVEVAGLLSLSLYHYVAVGANALGTNFGADVTFLTSGARSNVTFTPLVAFDGTNGGAGPQAGLLQTSNRVFYGTTYSGGDYNLGTVFKMTTNGALTVLTSFNGTNGANPQAGLALGPDGRLYGTTYNGGTNDMDTGGDGTVFKITTNGVLTSLFSFNVTNGANPAAGLALGPNGIFYGTTEQGGTNDFAAGGDGTIFSITTNGALVSLVLFDMADGANPDAGLMLATNGNFYGTTANGGTNGYGTVFAVTTNGTLTILYAFADDDGSDPQAGLVPGPDGELYGTTYSGGDSEAGTIFEITTNGLLTTLYSFTGGTDGGSPMAPLTVGADGNFYGTTTSGGAAGYGAVFVMTPDGALATLVAFDSDIYGANPEAGLTLGANGNFYGSAQAGGTNSAGTLFQFFVNPAPFIIAQPESQTNFTAHTSSFTVDAVGAAPLHYQWQRNSTNLTDHGNISGSATNILTLTNLALTDAANYSVIVSNSAGVVTSTVATLSVILPFPPAVTTVAAGPVDVSGATLNATVNPDGAYTAVWFSFGLTTNYGSISLATNIGNGGDPVSVGLQVPGLLPLSLYHFAAVGGNSTGTNTGLDMTFLTPGARSNVTFTVLAAFDDTNNGAGPQAGLLQTADGNFYGTTYNGGTYDNGTVYRMSGKGALTVLYSFDGTNGANPAAGLILGPDGELYGTTYDGGTNDTDNGGDGTVFKITTNGVITSLLSFNVTNGANPAAALAPGPNGILYGTTENGGTNDLANGGDGTIFSITTNGTFLSSVSFDTTNGANPDAPLVLAANGDFYGTTSSGGTNGLGTIFMVTSNGVLTVLYEFADVDGSDPGAGLLIGPGGEFYGTTYSGGDFGLGTIFEISTNGVLTTLYSFTGDTDGSNPLTPLTPGTDGNFYGTTSSGGASGFGTVFVITPDGALATLVAFDSDVYGANPQAGLTPGTNGSFYGNTQTGGTNDVGTLFEFNVSPAPFIITQPESTTNFTGHVTTFTVDAVGAAPLHYQWQRNATNLTDHGNISGSATNSLTLTNLALTDAASYSVIVSNSSGVVTSTVAILDVILPFAPAVTNEPASEVDISSATLNAMVTPDGLPTTVWFTFGLTTNYGSISSVTNIGNGGDPVPVNLNVSGLQSFSLYHFTAVGGNVLGTNRGLDLTFQTPGARSNVMFTPLVAFNGTNGGAGPQSGLFQAADGNFYGTTYYGGDFDDGMVFKMAGNGTLTVLLSFDGTNGANPAAGLVAGADGQLYGTTYDGGTNDLDSGGDGTIFKITTNGVLTSLVSFNVTNGANPAAGLTPGPGGVLYGTTESGGANDLANGGDGTIFTITTNGAFALLFSFNTTNGANPDAALTLASDGNFYGTTSAGGLNNMTNGGDGTVFKITTNGAFTSLASFNGTNGATPMAALAQGLDGNLYGTTLYGGTNNVAAGGDGMIFKITTNGVLTSLYSFTGGTDGANPQAALILGNDGNFYGTTSAGGTGGNGTAFEITPGGFLLPLVLFDSDVYGANPQAALTLGANGSFYGTASSGGTNFSGTVFSFDRVPVAPVFNPLLQAGSTFTLTWSAVAGQTYQLQYATNLTAPNWVSLFTITATNGTASGSDNMNAKGQRFYRLVSLP